MHFSRLIDFLETRAGPKIVVLLVMIILPFNVILFPMIGEKLQEISGYRMLDTMFYYSPPEVFTRLEAYQNSGRLLYLISSWSVDFVYPLLYSFLLAFLLTLFLTRSFHPGNPLIRLQLLPFCILFFDYLENACIAILLVVYPDKPAGLALTASFFSTSKWIFAGITFVALLFSIGVLLFAFSHKSNSIGKIQ